jgi:hypothetical protein
MPNYRNQVTGAIAQNAATVRLAYRECINGGVSVQLTGTWSGTLEFRVSNGDGFVPIQVRNVTNGAILTTTTTNGIYVFDVVGALEVEVAATAWTSGTAAVRIVGLGG